MAPNHGDTGTYRERLLLPSHELMLSTPGLTAMRANVAAHACDSYHEF